MTTRVSISGGWYKCPVLSIVIRWVISVLYPLWQESHGSNDLNPRPGNPGFGDYVRVINTGR